VLALSCSKDSKDLNKALSEKEFKLAANAPLNKELADLKNNLKNANTDFERAEIHTRISFINSEKGDVGASMKSAEEAIKFQPNQYMSHYLLGKSYLSAGRYNDAFDELEKAVTMKDNFAPAWFEYGNASYKRFDFPSAKKNYKKAIQHDPSLIDAYNNLAAIQIALGETAEAEKNLAECIRLNPAYAAAYKNLGIMYDTKLSSAAKAVENYRKYLTLRPDCPERNLVKMWISSLGG
jgi:tetratricopeptide (TPR) repeat protein